MKDRFKFRTPIYRADGSFKKFVFGEAVSGFPAITAEKGDVFKEAEQCTGLRDINGRLIYEGDFLINHDGNIGFIEFKYACFMLTAINEDNIVSTQDWTTCEVVGNIHENPELLEEKNENS